MKHTKLYSIILSVLAALFITTTAMAKDPVIVEITTNYKTVKEALVATKTSLLKRKFIPSGGMGESGFTATRTTGSKSDYYTADVMADLDGDHVKVTITFIKSGSGMLKLKNVAEEVKDELGGGSQSSGQVNSENSTSNVASTKPIPATLTQEQIQVKCTSFTKLKKGGIAMIIAGGSLCIGGAILQSLNTSSSTIYDAGRYMMPLGAIALSGGITLAIIGGKNKKHYCALQIHPHTNSIGFAMNL